MSSGRAAVAKWGQGKYGVPGGEAIAARFDQMTAGHLFASPVDTERGFRARLEYLLQRESGAQALADAGVPANEQKMVDWLSGAVTPNRKSRQMVETAYRRARSTNIAQWLKGQLITRDAQGNERGRKVDIEPLPGSAVPQHQAVRQSQFEDRRITISPQEWRALVDSWAQGDIDGMNDEWMDICDDALGSNAAGYYEVAHVGF